MDKIYISKSFMPPLREYNKYLKRIWKSHILTSQNGELVTELESRLKRYWGAKHVICVANGTSAIQISLRTLDVKEVYTSPFSFVATGSAPIWLGIKTKFYDFGEEPPQDKPHLLVHQFGIPNLTKRGSPIIYDAAAAFDTKIKGRSIMTFGDISAVSFSAVKIFQSGEGGAIVTDNKGVAEDARRMRAYGMEERYSFQKLGTNAKMSELQAAMALSVLPHVEKVRRKLNKLTATYNAALGLDEPLGCLLYYVVKLPSSAVVDKAIKEFESNNIYPRRYYYPPLNKIFGGKACPKAENHMSRLLALPFHYYLTKKDTNRVIKIIKKYDYEVPE